LRLAGPHPVSVCEAHRDIYLRRFFGICPKICDPDICAPDGKWCRRVVICSLGAVLISGVGYDSGTWADQHVIMSTESSEYRMWGGIDGLYRIHPIDFLVSDIPAEPTVLLDDVLPARLQVSRDDSSFEKCRGSVSCSHMMHLDKNPHS
jgi:hypothetical protein